MLTPGICEIMALSVTPGSSCMALELYTNVSFSMVRLLALPVTRASPRLMSVIFTPTRPTLANGLAAVRLTIFS